MSVLPRHVALVAETSTVDFDQISTVAAALQKQASRDFGPTWGVNATVDAFPTLESVPVDYWPSILKDDIKEPGAAGYHTDNHGQPFSLVQVDASWPLTASHEALEMLADPFGNRVIAGSPPAQAPEPISKFPRVVYLVEVCDPCESDKCSYKINGVTVSDFITPEYYDPAGGSGVRYSFRGNLKDAHTVLDGGYVSFGNPLDNHWYQIMVSNGKVNVSDLGILKSTHGKSLRELVDGQVRKSRKAEHYRTMAAEGSIKKASLKMPTLEASAARAKTLRAFIETLY
jgi:hypothetical protein